jgi:hypothetical protein
VILLARSPMLDCTRTRAVLGTKIKRAPLDRQA